MEKKIFIKDGQHVKVDYHTVILLVFLVKELSKSGKFRMKINIWSHKPSIEIQQKMILEFCVVLLLLQIL